jgi:hypothetical protein
MPNFHLNGLLRFYRFQSFHWDLINLNENLPGETIFSRIFLYDKTFDLFWPIIYILYIYSPYNNNNTLITLLADCGRFLLPTFVFCLLLLAVAGYIYIARRSFIWYISSAWHATAAWIAYLARVRTEMAIFTPESLKEIMITQTGAKYIYTERCKRKK